MPKKITEAGSGVVLLGVGGVLPVSRLEDRSKVQLGQLMPIKSRLVKSPDTRPTPSRNAKWLFASGTYPFKKLKSTVPPRVALPPTGTKVPGPRRLDGMPPALFAAHRRGDGDEGPSLLLKARKSRRREKGGKALQRDSLHLRKPSHDLRNACVMRPIFSVSTRARRDPASPFPKGAATPARE